MEHWERRPDKGDVTSDKGTVRRGEWKRATKIPQEQGISLCNLLHLRQVKGTLPMQLRL